MTHEEKVRRWLQPFRRSDGNKTDFGVEVGAFETPIPGIQPFYVDRFSEFAGKRVLANYWGDLSALPFRSHSLDYVAASHVLEHVANPVRALWECARVVRHRGILYFVLPDRRATFDHTRALTTAEHMMSDFDRGVTDRDGTHVDEYLDHLDWSRWNPAATKEENAKTREELRRIYQADLANGREINIHFHTFEQANFIQLISLMNRHAARPCQLEIVDHAEHFPTGRADGLLFVLSVHKGVSHRIAGAMARARSRGRAETALSPDAKPFVAVGQTVATTPAPAMSEQPPIATPIPTMHGCIDSPVDGDCCDPLGFRVEGWGCVPSAAAIEVQAWVGNTCAGSTSRFFVRTDVNQALGLPDATPTGFRLLAHGEITPGQHELELRIRRAESTNAVAVARRTVTFGAHDHRKESFGILLEPQTVGIMRREHMYTTGPSRGEGSAEVVQLLAQYLPPTPARIVDVGCGLGWYGRELRSRGYDWLGVEVKSEDCAVLSEQGLPHRQVDGKTLPFPDGAFDAALSIEVLEHIEDPRAFLSEVHRISPRMLLVSVPNAELVPYLHPYLATPRHMLDSDHRNFFTRWSLGSLLREYYAHAEVLTHSRHPLSSVDGTPLFYNLFAIAWS